MGRHKLKSPLGHEALVVTLGYSVSLSQPNVPHREVARIQGRGGTKHAALRSFEEGQNKKVLDRSTI